MTTYDKTKVIKLVVFKKTKQGKVKMFKIFKERTNYKYHLSFRKLFL